MMVKRGRWTGWRLAALAAGLPMIEAVLIDVFAPSARALAPQASALGPFGVFHDLRWLLVYHRSWSLFIVELTVAIVIRGVLIGLFVREAWPEDQPKPAARAAIARGILFTLGATVVLGPWAIIMFAQAVIPVSWFFFAAIPPFLIIAVLIDHASVSSWLRRPPMRVFGLVLLSFFVLSIGGALMTLSTRPAGVLIARMDQQVRVLNNATKLPVSIIAESEGSLIAERYLEADPSAPVDRLIVLSPILAPGSVYYPPRGRDGWGVAAGWGLRGLASVMSAVSPLHFEADAPIVRDVVDEPYAFADSCILSPVSRVEFLPLADAVAARADGATPGVKVVTAFHGGLLGDPAV